MLSFSQLTCSKVVLDAVIRTTINDARKRSATRNTKLL